MMTWVPRYPSLMSRYPSIRTPIWWREDPTSRLPKLRHIDYILLANCNHVKHVPPLRCIRYLRALTLYELYELDHVEGDDKAVSTTPSLLFKNLNCCVCRNQKELHPSMWKQMSHCFLNSVPLSPRLKTVYLIHARKEMIQQQMSACSLQDIITLHSCSELTIPSSFHLQSLHFIIII